MDTQYILSNVAKDYITVFYCILDEMIHGMTDAELTDSISHNFIVQMIPHHRAAIQMSENILKYTTSVPLQNIAEQIISEQTKSIANMEQAKAICSELTNTEQDICLYQSRFKQITHTMFTDMQNAPATNHINCDFMWQMIPHHRGAVEMSKNVLRFKICPCLKPILYAIIESQERGIAQMQNLLKTMKCKP